ncbi:hypothetical protein N7456_007968 [Penicillium angulare]|uniref:N-acetyltransferase domain-containing protein n=1 Tax=Penicillium angulare TaxID=116970 RepID=A0A9W9K9R6_9EURO|nr:hypothetical protein N7456_007968 [Penicillium angulare]
MAAPPPTSDSDAILIPKTYSSPKDLDEIINRFKKLRLHSLKVDPVSFSSTYEEESQFPHDKWRSRIQSPLPRTFIAINDTVSKRITNDTTDSSISSPCFGDTSTSLLRLIRSEWVGMATLLGPITFPEETTNEDGAVAKPWDAFIKDQKYKMPGDVSKVEDLKGAHIVYLVVAVFTLPEVRRNGHASRLLKVIIKAIHDDIDIYGAAKASITIQLEPENPRALRLYESLGFSVWEKALPMADPWGNVSHVISLGMTVHSQSD